MATTFSTRLPPLRTGLNNPELRVSMWRLCVCLFMVFLLSPSSSMVLSNVKVLTMLLFSPITHIPASLLILYCLDLTPLCLLHILVYLGSNRIYYSSHYISINYQTQYIARRKRFVIIVSWFGECSLSWWPGDSVNTLGILLYYYNAQGHFSIFLLLHLISWYDPQKFM